MEEQATHNFLVFLLFVCWLAATIYTAHASYYGFREAWLRSKVFSTITIEYGNLFDHLHFKYRHFYLFFFVVLVCLGIGTLIYNVLQ